MIREQTERAITSLFLDILSLRQVLDYTFIQ